MRIRVAVAALALTVAGSADAKKVEHKVEVDGATYRVSVVGNVVTVSKKSFVVSYSVKERDAMRAAVKKATGCEVVDEIPNGAKLRGKLQCAAAG